MPRSLRRCLFLVALFAGALGLAAPALAADQPFAVRFAQTERGSINAVGNQLLTCPAAATGCTDARNRIGTTATLNNNYNMEYVDVDADATTVNSSTSTLALPAGATVVWAGLYWGADTAAGTGGLAAPNAAIRDTVRFKVGSGSYQTVTAAPADVLSSTGKATRYRGFANVTSQLPAAGNGTYTVADVQTGRGDDRFAGWSLVVAYRDPTEGFHRISVYDGLGTVDATHTFSTNIAPFYTPASGSVATKTGLLAFEGDAGIVGETATFNGTALTDAINGPGNLMNSTMAVDGTLFTAKNPNNGNLQGTDIDVWNRTGLLGNHQSSATLAFASNQDLFVPSALWLVSDEGPAFNTAGPTVGGLARDGSTLTANAGTWEGTPTITYTYQWQRCDSAGANCVNVPGATGTTYTLGAADVGSTVRVLVTAVNDAGPSAPSASAPTATVTQLPPSNVTVPAVSGVARDDQTLTTTLGGWDGTAPLGYDVQWQRCNSAGASCVDIAGATAWSYTLTGSDIGARIRSEVTATNAAGSATAVSVPTSLVVSDPPANTTLPPVSGVARDGQTLTAGTGAWTGTDPLSYAYQWRRCDSAGANCADIAGATASTYALTGADIGHELRVRVTATNVAGNANASSSPTAPVIATPPANTVVPTISGTPRDAHTLTLARGTWTGTTPITYSYVWQRCDSAGASCQAISGATGTTYALTGADLGSRIRALVTASNVAGVATVATTPSAVITADPPANTGVPVVTGDRVDGETLTAAAGTWTGTQPVVYTYQWRRCDSAGANCVDLAGATNPSYTLTGGDIGKVVRVVVTATNQAGSAVATSAVSVPVQPDPPVSVVAPTTTGTARSGQVLTAHNGTWTGSDPLTLTHQWLRCDSAGDGCVAITGATGATYTLTDADAGHTVRVAVTGTNGGGTDTGRSTPTAVVAGNPPAGTVAPAISGTVRDGQTLTLDDGDWTGTSPLTYEYQWQRCNAAGGSCADIPGATGLTYTLRGADVGGTIIAVVTATNAYGEDSATTVKTAVVAAAPPAVTVAPSVSGTAVDGQTLTADRGTWSGTGPVTYEYRWLRCAPDGTSCVPISGATDDEYALTGADVGHGIRVEVTATNVAGSTTGRSPVVAVSAAPPVSTTRPSVSGSNAEGQTLTATPGSWSGTTPLDLDYQWQRCNADGSSCADVAGATGSTYDLTAGDVGHAIRVEVTATNIAGADTAVSAPTDAALPAPPVNTAQPPAPTGTTVDGGTLTADPGTWTGDLPIDYDYQWQRCADDGTACVDIAGATGETYTPAGADVGHAIVVVVTATNPGGSTSEASAPTTPVLAAPPVNTSVPTITGTPEDGGTLTADPGTWTGTTPIDYEYQWQVCDADGANCTDIAGATDDTYTPDAGDIGHKITVVVTAGNDGGEETAVAVVTPVIVASPPRDTVSPTVTGDVGIGDVLTADPGTWSGTDPIDYDYQWQRCDEDGTHCVDVAGATDPTYTIVAGDQGHAMVVVVTATNAVDSDTAASDPVVVPAPPVNTVAPSISGDEQVGETLTADPGTWAGTGPITYEYQWQRCDFSGDNCVDIVGATGEDYTLIADDLGHTITVVVTASNAAGAGNEDAPITPAVDSPTPTPTPTATPSPNQPLASSPGVASGPLSSDSAFAAGSGGPPGDDLGSVPGSLVGDTSCQQLAGNSKYSRVKAKGIGTVRVRAYATGPATKVSPVLVTTQISGGKAKRVTYKLDGRKLKAKRGKSWKSAITPAQLQKIGIHTLTATIKGRKKGAKTKLVKVKLKTVPCRTLFTAQRWRTTAGAGLRLRIDARTAMQRVSFTVAAPLLPRQVKKARTIGFMRVFVAGESGRRRFSLKLAKKGGKKALVSGAGKPTVTLRKGKIDVSGLPARAAVTELTLYRVKKLDGTTKRRVFKLRARVAPTGGTLSVRPKAPR